MKKIILPVFVLCGISLCLTGQSLSANQLPAQTDQISSVQLYDRNDHPLRSFLSAQDTYAAPIAFVDISPWLLQAVVAIEDRRFYTHKGVDFRAMMRAAWQNMRGKRVISGASTITQQLARSLRSYPKNWRGKLSEAYEAFRLERAYTKQEILEQYLNKLEFGNQTQGVEAAAQFYFNTTAAQLSLAQSALLAGVIQAPSRLNPLENPSGALRRRGNVLAAMLREKMITPQQYELAMKEPLGVRRGERPFSAPHFSQLVYKLIDHPSQIHTTLDKDLQLYAEKTIRTHLSQLTDQNVTNGAVVVLDTLSGEILAYVGSGNFYDVEHSGQIDGVLARRQPGSALKPFVYALALQNGWTAASILRDDDTFFEGGFRPRNYDESFHGKVTIRQALANSYNVPVIKVAESLGATRILAFLHELDFHSLTHPAEFYGLGIALGGGEVTLLELANAYATLARGGRVKPVIAAQEPRLLVSKQTSRVIPEEIAYIVTDILSDNAARADAFGLNSPLSFPFPTAAKTGTSKDYKDNFAIAYTPRLTAAVWVGNFDASSMQKVSGITGAAPILHDVLMYAYEKYPSGAFVRPRGVVSAKICTQSGQLAGPHCTHTREEVFTQDTAPHQVCNGKHSLEGNTLQIISPAAGDVYKYDPALPTAAQVLHIQTTLDKGPCAWKLNGKTLSETGADFWWPLEKGKFDLSVTCGAQSAETSFIVL